MDEELLNIEQPIIFDESIAHYEVHTQQPYTSSTYNNSDEIRIAVQNQDHCLLPSKSSIHISGKLLKTDGTPVTHTSLVSNGVCHLFEEAKYELNGVEIDKNKNVAFTSLMKNYVSFDATQSKFLENVGWLDFTNDATLTNAQGYFDVCIPLNMIFGFAEDYKKIVVNAKHELIFTRSRIDSNVVRQTAPLEEYKIVIEKVEWLLPNQYSTLYEMYTNLQDVYYGKESQPLLTKKEFLQYALLIVIDCSKQNETLKSGPVISV
ncbi:uncharacterized protein LOC122506106 [Leptopilina heterotoma]|uniref:uncharacterized protein LOC122506106 n=1 Tax=Leptopilina heterotoma TaxID=63436 RepID=UPI001CA8F958|nr:uncharacterized protein LOC122506106 [Leptopilina heterotoma]